MTERTMALAEAPPLPSAQRLPLTICVGWGLGAFAVLALLNVMNGLVLKFTVDEIGMSAAFAGTAIGAIRFIDALVDPAMGVLSDRTHSRWGRRRPYILIGGLLCALAPLVVFVTPNLVTAGLVATVVILGQIFYSVAYTVFNVPHMAMPVEMTRDRRERTHLVSFRIYGSACGSLVGSVAAPWLLTQFGGGRAGFAGMALVLAPVILIAMGLCFLLTAKAPFDPVTRPVHVPFGEQVRTLLGNRPLLHLLTAKVFIVACAGVSAASMAFYITHVLHQSLNLLALYGLCATVGMGFSQPVWVRVGQAIGKRRGFFVAAAGYALAVTPFLFLGPDVPKPLFGAIGLVLGISGGGVFLMSQSMLPDALEHDARRTGQRREGVLTGLYTTIERGASAMGVAGAGTILGLAGYVAGATPDADTLAAMRACVSIVPAIGMICAAIALSGYRLEG